MNARTERINQAIEKAKERDKNKCRVCGSTRVDGAHILPRNVAFPWYHADRHEWIISLCRNHHRSFDQNHSPESREEWLKKHGLVEDAFKIKLGMEGLLHE